ncbi:MAG: TetM/TetW/TetO/TetS family tetracycline resistance ribosomal protection protein [Lachnospiraceae bacterium]|nr:TetM/TetW/TetO/TetS family tetracycline resistance ribosomal protection protein [Lachnospiraceae bacterium]
MRNINIGLLAHVDAGKTTLSENILYNTGAIRSLGRVDHKDTYLDNYAMEKERGITIFSKQARVKLGELDVTLLDTPGHADFSSEMERVLSVLDLAVLIVSAPEGIQSHTRTLWKLLEHYEVPTVIFVNKTDMPGTDRNGVLSELKEGLGKLCVDLENDVESGLEEISSTDEELIEEYLETGTLCDESIKSAIERRQAFPVWFGSALKGEGIGEFLKGIERYAPEPYYDEEVFGARVFKITRSLSGERLTHMKITGGKLSARMVIPESEEEKIDQIRIYNGEKYETVGQAGPGMVVAVTGLSKTAAGQGIGAEKEKVIPELTPVLRYKIITAPGENPLILYGKIKAFEEEYPELSFAWNERHKEIFVNVNGEIQLQVLKSIVKERLDSEISFGAGSIVYKETVRDKVYGIGHFEPLRHYAEVQLLIEPGEPGSGIEFASACSMDILDKNWQRLIETHVMETVHPGTLTGSEVTDIRVILMTGRAHPKHTEGGDFRQATYRALRNALRQALAMGRMVLLEPVYEFTMTLPSKFIGKAMTDIDRMYGKANPPELTGDGNTAILKGTAPVSTFWEYTKELTAYTAGEGILTCHLAGFEPCHNQDEVVSNRGYDPETDMRRPTGSVFCAHGAGFQVPWNEVAEYAHMPNPLDEKSKESLGDGLTIGESARNSQVKDSQTGSHEEKFISIEEIDAIFASQHRNRKEDAVSRRKIYKRGRGSAAWDNKERIISASVDNRGADSGKKEVSGYRGKPALPNCLLVDGYNMIHAWSELKALVGDNIHGARERLVDICSEYQSIVGGEVIVVFDAYLVPGGVGSMKKLKNVYVVYTKEAETADQYIEQATKKKAKDYRVSVATSDHMEQLIVWSDGALRMSAAEFEAEIERARKKLREDFGIH